MEFPQKLAAALAACSGMDAEQLESMIEIPPDSSMGDFAFPCFRLSKALRKAPPAIASELSLKLALPPFVARTEAVGGYINFFIKPEAYAEAVLSAVRGQHENYGGSTEGAGRNICIDYSSINIAKPFHIGHLSSTVIGHSLYRIYQHLGYNCVGINHLGDWGTQFGKLIVAYKRWGNRAQVERDSIRALLDLYVKFHDEAEKDERLNDEARAWFKRIEDSDEEALSLFEWFKALTLKEVGRVYDLLGIAFDSYAGESFYNDKMSRVIEELEEKSLLKLDQGAYLVDLSDYGMPPCLVLRSDGATLYATRDIAAALYRKDTYDFAKCLYVVAYQQDLHFRQWFKVVELMGYPWAKDLVHVSFGMVSLVDGTLSTRKGKVLFLEDVLNAAIEKTLEIITEKSPNLQDKPAVARQVGVGAVVWNALYNSRIKDVVFSWDKALNFEGETGPYVQYTHARCCAVLRKANVSDIPEDLDYRLLSDEDAMRVIRAMGDFPRAVREAAQKYEPYLVSRAVVAVCQAYNKFYYEQRIIGEEEQVEKARLALTAAAKSVISTGLFLVGLAAPERM
ncbi:MAG TPA: arginine--tRNA ligase [Feifaniaceae bacterium]|nr:arginine--tRNA ligase [Feifaniaceae bacterium]